MEIEFGSSCLWKTQRDGEVIKYFLRFFASPTHWIFFVLVQIPSLDKLQQIRAHT